MSRLSAVVAAIICLPQTPALAASTADEIVVSATRTPRPITEVGSTVTVLTAAEIQLRQYSAVTEIVRDIAGASVAANGPFGGFASARLRGASSGQSIVVIDGVVMNDPSSPAGGYNFANLDVVDIDRIEVLRGPQSVLYGADAIGGVIAITTKRGGEARPAAFIEAGSFGAVRGGASIAGGDDRRDARMTISAARADGISRAAVGDEADGFRNLSVSAAGGFNLGDAWRMDLFGRYGDARTEIDGFPPPAFTLDDTDGVERTEKTAFALRIRRESESLSQSINLSFNDIERANFEDGRFAFGANGDRIAAEYIARYDFSRRVSLLAGLEGEQTRAEVSGVDDRMRSGAVFALLETEVVPALQISVGARRDEFSSFDGATTARITGAWRAAPGTIVRMSWGEGFRAPSLFQLNYNLFGGLPNPDLRPESASAFDAGVEQRFGAGAVRVVFFEQKIRDQIDFDFVTGGYINIARVRARGAEVEASWSPADNLALSANYTYADAIDRETGAPLLRQPAHRGSLFADWRLTDALSLGATFSANGAERDFPSDNARWFRLDLRGALKMNDRIEIFARGVNLTDAEYQDVSGYAEPGLSVFAGVRVRG